MKRLNEKGFTIVELVIVIAVVAVLAAVLIPTFSEVIEEAQMAKDVALYRNIQTIIQAERTLGNDISDYEKAMEVLRKNGINDITTYSDTYSISWDDSSCNFVLISSEGSVIPGDGQDDENEVQPNPDEGKEEEEEEEEDMIESVTVSTNLNKDIFDLSEIPETTPLNGEFRAKLVQKSVRKEYYITSFSITMGGVDITPEGFDPNDEKAEINIFPVTGNIEISATIVVNQVRLSKDLTGNYYYGYYGDLPHDKNTHQTTDGPGYINDYFLSTDTNTDGICAKSGNGHTSTGWIEIPWNKTTPQDIDIYIYIKDGSLQINSGNVSKFIFYTGYISSSKKQKLPELGQLLIENNYIKITLRKELFMEYPTDPENCDYNYFRVSVKGKGENLVVTFNKPIFQAD